MRNSFKIYKDFNEDTGYVVFSVAIKDHLAGTINGCYDFVYRRLKTFESEKEAREYMIRYRDFIKTQNIVVYTDEVQK